MADGSAVSVRSVNSNIDKTQAIEILQESLRTCQQLGIEIRTRNMNVNGVDVVVMVLQNAKIEAGNIHLEGARVLV